MRYLIDKNSFSGRYMRNEEGRKDLFVLQDVLEESEYGPDEISEFKKAGINILKPSKKHLEKLKDVMADIGKNLDLVNLYTAQGVADAVMIAFALAEQESNNSLFEEPYVIVTKDQGLITAAKKYSILCVDSIID